jgi:hypothetical protein
MCGRLQVGKSFLGVCGIGRCSHVFGLLARTRAAGHNALRGFDLKMLTWSPVAKQTFRERDGL